MIILGGVALPDLFFENRFDYTGVEAETEMAKAGNIHVFERAIQGRAIDLNGDIEGAWMELQEIQELMAIASVVGAAYQLNLHGQIINVRFRHEEPPVFSAIPVLDRRDTEPQPTQKYSRVKIKLMEV